MKGYAITTRGWAALAVALLLLVLLVGGVVSFISPLFSAPGDGLEPSPSPTLPDILFSLPPRPTPDIFPSAGPAPTPTPVPIVITPPPASPTLPPDFQAGPTAPANPNPGPAKQPSFPAQTPSEMPASAQPTIAPTAAPTMPPPEWAEERASVLFLWNSDELADPEVALEDLTRLLPPPDEMADYLIYIEGFRSNDETAGNLEAKRAAAVETLLLEALSVDPALIRVKAVTKPSALDRTRQRADVSFKLAGSK